MKKELETTPEIRLAKMLVDTLEASASKTLTGSLFQRVSMADKILYIKEMSTAKANLWERVYKQYPQVYGCDVSVGEYKLTYTPKVE